MTLTYAPPDFLPASRAVFLTAASYPVRAANGENYTAQFSIDKFHHRSMMNLYNFYPQMLQFGSEEKLLI